MNGLQMNMILARFTILEDKLNLLLKAEAPDEMAIEVTPAAEVPETKGFNPDVKGPDDPDNKANQKDPDEGTEEDVVNDQRLSKGPLVDAVDKYYSQFPQEKDELSNENDNPSPETIS